MTQSRQYSFGPYVLDASRRLLTRGTEQVGVTARAFDVLLVLLERRGETVAKDDLLQRVWPDTIVEEANLSQQIFTIRKLLGHSDTQPYIATVPRRGYRFVATVSELPPAPAAVAPEGAISSRPSPIRLCVTVAPAALALGPTGAIAISPDGSRIVYAIAVNGVPRLCVRELHQFDSTEIPGTEGACHPFFSPDGEWVGFQSGRRLLKVSLSGGLPLALCEVVELRGATWSPSGDIVFAPAPTACLWRVGAEGGAPKPLTTIAYDSGERTHRWPHALPDGRGIVFTIGRAGDASFDEACLAVTDLEAAGHRVILQHGTDGRYVRSGHLAWARGGALIAAPFDLLTRSVQAPGRPVQSGVAAAATGVAHFAVAATGTLVHVPGPPQTLHRSLVSVDGTGRICAQHVRGEALEEPRLAHDGRTAIVSLRGRSSDLWLFDFARRAITRVTFEGENFAGIWGPVDGALTFSSSRAGGPSDLYIVRPDRAGPPELLVASEFDKAAGMWSNDGAALLFTEYHPQTGADIWVLNRTDERARPFVRTPFNEYGPAFSPDGRLVAYTTDESGRPEIHLVSFPEGTGKRQLSIDGGVEPLWSRDGRAVFYRSGDRLMRVDMSRGAAEPGIPTTLFEGKYEMGGVTLANYDVAADDTGFLMVRPDVVPPPISLCVTLGWFSDLS